MKRIIRLTESDLTRIVRRVINEAYDDNWTSALQPMVDAVNSKLPKGSVGLIVNGPSTTPTGGGQFEQINASIGIDTNALGLKGSGRIFNFGIMKRKSDGLVQAISVTVYNPIAQKPIASAQKTLDIATNKLKYTVTPDFQAATIREVGKFIETETSGIEKLRYLGYALYGRKFKTADGTTYDCSQVPTGLNNGLNSVKKALQAYIPVKA